MLINNPTRRELISVNLIEILIIIVLTGVIAIIINKIIGNRKGIVSKNKKNKMKIISIIIFTLICFLSNNIFGIMAISGYYYGFWQCLINLIRLYLINFMLELIFLRNINISKRLVNIIPMTIIENIIFIVAWIAGEIIDNSYISILIIVTYKSIVVLKKYKFILNNMCKISILVLYIILVGITSGMFVNSFQKDEEEIYSKKGIFLEGYRETYSGITKTDWKINIRN